jgi:hypothetical protein
MKFSMPDSYKKSKVAVITIVVAGCVLGGASNFSSTVVNVSPCALSLPIPCSESIDKLRLNYTQHSYGYPATYKKVAVSERLQPRPLVSTTMEIIPFNPLVLVSNILFWTIVLGLGLKVIRKLK